MGIPEGIHTVTPYLTARDVEGLLAFMKSAFGGVETYRAEGGGGLHVETRIGDSMLMVGGGAQLRGDPATAMLYLDVDDVDGSYKRAIEAGAHSLMEPASLPDGHRRAGVRDAFRNQWYFGKTLS